MNIAMVNPSASKSVKCQFRKISSDVDEVFMLFYERMRQEDACDNKTNQTLPLFLNEVFNMTLYKMFMIEMK